MLGFKTPFLSLLSLFILSPAWVSHGSEVDPELERMLLNPSFYETFQRASQTRISETVLDRLKESLERNKKEASKNDDAHIGFFKNKHKSDKKAYDAFLKRTEKAPSLADQSSFAEEKRALLCSIHDDQVVLADLQRDKYLKEAAAESQIAKVEILKHWPSRQKKIQEEINSGEPERRKFGNFQRIGSRKITGGNELSDQNWGYSLSAAIEKSLGESAFIQDPAVEGYVKKVVQKVADSSDLKVEPRIKIINSDSVNAFSLPGGYLYLNRGLLTSLHNEAELAGVAAYELAHIAARHHWRTYKQFLIKKIAINSAEIAALIASGGFTHWFTFIKVSVISDLASHPASLAYDLALRTFFRKTESEANQLATQYLWKAGYDSREILEALSGRYSDHPMKVENLRVSQSITHDRIERIYREIQFLPGSAPSGRILEDTSGWHVMQAALAKIQETTALSDLLAPKSKKDFKYRIDDPAQCAVAPNAAPAP